LENLNGHLYNKESEDSIPPFWDDAKSLDNGFGRFESRWWSDAERSTCPRI